VAAAFSALITARAVIGMEAVQELAGDVEEGREIRVGEISG
jgi:hypothetical protein